MNNSFFNRYNFQNSPYNYTTPLYNYNHVYNKTNLNTDNITYFSDIINSNTNTDNINTNENVENVNTEKQSRKPITINNSSINIFGFNLKFDDIIIIGIVIFLLLEKNIDYLLLIILALILFDLSFDSIKNLKLINDLFGAI